VRSPKLRLTTYKGNAWAFAITLLGSVFLSSVFPPVRAFVGRQAQYQLCRSANNGSATTVKALLFFGANPHGPSPSYRPIHFAARNGHTRVVEILLDEGADVNGRGSWNETALMDSVWNGRLDTARLLLSRGADLFLGVNGDGFGTALWQAARADRNEMAQLLMKNGARTSYDAESVLTLAVENNNTELVQTLLAGGVDPRDVEATSQVIPLTQLAAKRGNKEMLRALRNAGAK
jgi:ankyrin repeat protein